MAAELPPKETQPDVLIVEATYGMQVSGECACASVAVGITVACVARAAVSDCPAMGASLFRPRGDRPNFNVNSEGGAVLPVTTVCLQLQLQLQPPRRCTSRRTSARRASARAWRASCCAGAAACCPCSRLAARRSCCSSSTSCGQVRSELARFIAWGSG